ncbi:hypothetical protein [uncultured Megasphaera sp.]|uniref:hypothetical protein n=1 Tax=uncultured Megasphaera sp. TaxID=165188 RepID=UPI0025CCCD09|nr:hypothetical protein [uncultured Megasphaera sp.]
MALRPQFASRSSQDASEKAVARGSLLVKNHHYTKTGCDGISLRAAQPRLSVLAAVLRLPLVGT